MHLRSKLTSEMCQKVGRLDGKTEQKRFKKFNLPLPPFFFQKTITFIEKQKTLIDFLM